MAIITEEMMEGLRQDFEDIKRTLRIVGYIEPRNGNPFESLPLAIQKVMEAGGFEPFPTEALLLASTPTVSPKAAKAMDTKKVWYWGKYSEAETVDSWHDTGFSELDQAKTYTDEQFNLAVQKSVFETLSQLFGLAKSDDEKI
ncbi:hypothetical protein PX038_00005, partial [Acinetobacter baumannii]